MKKNLGLFQDTYSPESPDEVPVSQNVGEIRNTDLCTYDDNSDSDDELLCTMLDNVESKPESPESPIHPSQNRGRNRYPECNVLVVNSPEKGEDSSVCRMRMNANVARTLFQSANLHGCNVTINFN